MKVPMSGLRLVAQLRWSLVWFGDSTWIHANNPPRVAWRDEADEHGNEDKRAQAGVGARVGTDCFFSLSGFPTHFALGFYAFINTSVGVLRKQMVHVWSGGLRAERKSILILCKTYR